MGKAAAAAAAHPERRVLQFAGASRAVVSLVALLTAQAVTPYDTSTRLEAGSNSLLSAFANWDGVYYAHIARHGYDYEHVHAFFPLYPLLMRALSWAFAPLGPSIATLTSGWIISNVSFVLAALWLYRLGRLVLNDELVARRAAYLFCIAPSSIFMSAVYSESLMCALSFCGMLFLENYKRSGRFSELLLSAVVFGCASATRSNGILLSLYIAWHRLSVSPSPATATRAFLRYWIVTALLGVIAIGPQIAYFVYGLLVYCPSLFGSYTPLSLMTDDRSWCAKVIPNFSAMYTFIQSEYWNVGLFKYYELKQIPNFLLAAPILILSAYSLYRFFQAFWSSSHQRGQVRTSLEAPYYVHWLFLFVNALLVVHIQVTTRLLSACPSLFWAPAAFMLKCVKNDSSSGGENSTVAELSTMSLKGKLVVGYFLLYCVLGAVLFPSFYPWT